MKKLDKIAINLVTLKASKLLKLVLGFPQLFFNQNIQNILAIFS
jgi:hypothetical protein